MTPWNIKHLKTALDNDLLACNTSHEKIMCKAISGKEIREKAYEFAKVRKLTHGEIAIAEEFGYKS